MTSRPRCAGVLCHVTSLPGSGPSGTLGAVAMDFVDFVGHAGLSIWQMLPLNPPDSYGSPYHSASLFALNPGLLDPALRLSTPGALAAFVEARSSDYERFVEEQEYWLRDYSRYTVASALHGPDWSRWPAPMRIRQAEALAEFDARNRAALEHVCWLQFAVDAGFMQLRAAANSRGLQLFGDMPLYPAFDSADVWSHQDLFLIDAAQRPRYVAGVPPDYFSTTGQLWGNPVYDWDRLAATDFAWWLERVRSQLRLFDIVRIDHFRGLAAYWAIPTGATSATEGHWRPAPGHALLAAIQKRFGVPPLVAEDLGVITPDVDELRATFGLPGMRVVQFAFSGDPDNPHLPAHYVENTVAYTGTHDNDTTMGWYASLDANARAAVDRLVDGAALPWSLTDLALQSAARTAIVPMQDFLGLGSRARMNTPGVTTGNWRWRFESSQLTPELARQIKTHLTASGRARG